MFSPLSLVLALLPLQAFANGQRPPYYDELEHILVDTGGYNDAGLARGVTPCSFYNQGSQNAGRQSAAQWLRVSFHDFATYNAATQTGGIDASIGFETLRDENHGSAMNETLTFFAPFVNKYTSMADMIALGTIIAIRSCHGPLIDFKGGRIDATGPGIFGVPDPEDETDVIVQKYTRAGFSVPEMAESILCGHTIGGVHASGFPTIGLQSAVSPTNTNGRTSFDTSFDTFDNRVAVEYVQGTTANLLVVGPNVTTRSDLRVLQLDNNKTAHAMSVSNDAFFDICSRNLAKIFNSVPKAVQLYDIKPRHVKPVNTHLILDSKNNLALNGSIRLLSSKFPANPNRVVQISYKYRDGSDCSGQCTTTAVFKAGVTQGQSFFGDTFYYIFTLPIDNTRGISQYIVTISEGTRVAPSTQRTYDIQDTVFWLQSKSDLVLLGKAVVGSVAVAVRTSPKPTSVVAKFSVPLPQMGTLSPKVTSFSIPLKVSSTLGSSGYTLWTSGPDGPVPEVGGNMTLALRSTLDITAVVNGQSFTDDFRKLAVFGK